MNDYLLQEMVRIRMDELRQEAARAREARRSRGLRQDPGILGVLGISRSEGGFSRGTVEGACCA